MSKAELAEAIRLRGALTRKPAFVTALFAGFGNAWRRVMVFLGAVFALASLGRAKPVVCSFSPSPRSLPERSD